MQVIEEFQTRRAQYNNRKGHNASKSSNQGSKSDCEKPRIQEFLQCFEEQVLLLNKAYKSSKMQFENDMKAYKDCDLFPEEEEEKQENTPSFNQK